MAIKQIAGTFNCLDKFGNNTAFYKANAGDITTVTFDVSESIYFATNNQNIITCNSVLRTAKKLQFPNYSSLNGFAVGQTVVLTKTTTAGATTTVTTTIVAIDYTLLQIEFAALLSPTSANLFLYDNNNVMTIYATSLREDLYLNLGFTKSSSVNEFDKIQSVQQGIFNTFTNNNRRSLIDGQQTRLFGEDAGSVIVGASTTLIPVGFQSGNFEVLTASIERNTNINTYTRSFTVTLEIIQQGSLIQSAFNSSDSQFLKLYFDLEWYSVNETENPTVVSWNFGNSKTGWFNSPFTEFPIDSTYVSGAGILYFSGTSQRTVVIESTSSVIALGAMYFPQDDSYFKNKVNNQSELCMLIEQNGALAVGTYTSKTNPTGANYEIEIISHTYVGTTHTIVYEFTPNSAFTTFINGRGVNDRVMYIWFKVGNINQLDWQTEILEAPLPIEDLLPYKTEASKWLLDKSTDVYTADSLSTGAIVSIQDNLRYELKALLPNAFLYKSVQFQMIVAEIADLDNNFVLENYFFDISNVGSQPNGALNQFNLLQPVQNNTLPTTNTSSKNVQVSRKGASPDTPTHFGLFFRYPTFINWRFWLEQLNAFAIFDEGRTQNWINYNNGTYQIFLKVIVECEDRFLVTHAPIKEIYDYDEAHTDTNEEWNGTTAIQYSVESTGEVTPSLVNGQIMRVKVTVNNDYAATLSTCWGQLSIEKKESSPRFTCSTNYNHDNNINSPFVPIEGTTRLKQTIVSPTQSTYEMLIDTNRLDSIDYTITLKYFNDVTPIEQVRTEFEVKCLDSSLFGFDDQVQEDEDCCQKTFNVFAETTLTKTYKNDVTGAWKLLLGDDSVAFELYKDYVLVETISNITFPSQTNARYCQVIWRDVLLDHGTGCYELKVKYTFDGQDIYTTWGIYNLQEWSVENVTGFVRLRAIFNTQQSIEGIDFTNANVVDTINVEGFFGKRDPKMEVRNNVYSNRLTTKVTREYLNSYEFTTNPITRTFSRKLLDLFFISENDIYITDYNTFNHEIYIEKRLIVEESPTIEHYDFSNLIKIICKFGDKIKNQRSFH